MASFYGSAMGFITYCSERGYAAPTDVLEIEAKLIIASEWIDAIYRSNFPGIKTDGREQEREWPRRGAYDIYYYDIPVDEVPREVIFATYEAALREFDSPGALSKDYTPSKYKSAAVSGAVSVTYATFDNVREAQTKFAKVAEWIAPILITNADSSNLVGSAFRI